MVSHSLFPDLINFVVTNLGGCSFSLEATASVLNLKRSIADSCNVSPQFEIQLLRETIVSLQTPSTQVIAEIPKIISVVNDLNHIWNHGFRIPITVHPIIPAVRNTTALESLSKLFGGADPNVYDRDWYRFILQCWEESPTCTIQDLCDRFEKHFKCSGGKLESINLHQKLTGHVDLNFLPNTVVALMLERNLFTDILGLEQLNDKVLTFLDIRSNPLEIDLGSFVAPKPPSLFSGNSLRYIRVNVHQISWHLLGIRCDKLPKSDPVREKFTNIVHEAVRNWFPSSILDGMTVGYNILKKDDSRSDRPLYERISSYRRHKTRTSL